MGDAMTNTERRPPRDNLALRRTKDATESLASLRDKSSRARWLLSGALAGTVVAATLGGRAAASNNRVEAASFLVPATALLLLALAQVAVLLVYGDKVRVKQFVIGTEEEADELEHAGGAALGPYMAFSHRQMTRFECVALTQANLSHIASLLAAGLGFVVLTGGAWITLTHASGDATVAGAIMTGVGTALSGFLSVTFLRTFEITTEQMSYYYGQPMVNCYLLHAERLLERCDRGLGADQRRQDVQEVVTTILDVATTAQSHLLDRDALAVATRHRRQAVGRRRPATPPPTEPALNATAQTAAG